MITSLQSHSLRRIASKKIHKIKGNLIDGGDVTNAVSKTRMHAAITPLVLAKVIYDSQKETNPDTKAKEDSVDKYLACLEVERTECIKGINEKAPDQIA